MAYNVFIKSLQNAPPDLHLFHDFSRVDYCGDVHWVNKKQFKDDYVVVLLTLTLKHVSFSQEGPSL